MFRAKKVESSVKSLSERLARIGETSSRIGSALSIGITAPLLALGTAAVKTTADMDALRQGMVKVTGSSAEAERQLARLKVIARQPGLGFEEAIKGSLRLQSAGLSAKQAEGALREFGNAIAAVGGGKEQLDGVTVALAQIASKGKVTAEEINQIAERFYGVREAMVRAFGTSDSEVLQKAKLSASEYIDGMVSVLSQDRRVGDSLKNQFETAQDDIKESLDKLGKAVAPRVAQALGNITSAVTRMADAFDRLPKEKQDLLTSLGLGVMAAGPITSVLGNLASLAAKLELVGINTKVIASLARGGAIGLAVGAVMSLGTAFYSYSVDKNARETEQTAGRPYYLDAEEKVRGNRQKIVDIEAAAAARRKQSGGGGGDTAYLAGIGGLLNPSEEAEIKRIRSENAKLESMASLFRGKAETAQKRAEQEQKRQQKAAQDMTARARRMEEQEKARKEALAEAERRRKEKEANDKQFRDDAARRVKDAQDRLAEITLPPILQKQRDARQRFQEDKYYGVPGAEALLQGTLWSNAGEEAGKQLKDFDLSEILSSGGQDVSKGLAKIQQAQQKAWAARLKMFMTSDVRGTVDSIGATINGIKAGQKSDKKDNQFEIRQVRATLENQVAPSFGNMFASLAQTMDSLVKNSPRVRAKAMGAEAARDAGRIGSQAFMDLAQGRNVIGNALERVKGEVFGAIGEEIGRGVERSLRKRLSKVFEDAISEGVGKKLEGALEGSLKGIEASAGAILSASYNLVAALSRKKKFGIGTALGIAAGLLIPGAQPFLPALANAGNAIDNSDWKGLVLVGASTYAGSRLDVGGSPANTSSATLGAGTTATGRGRSMVIVNHYGNINGMEDLEGASQRQGRAIERALAFS